MIQHQNVWLPDGEKHLVDWMTTAGEIVDGKGTYQIKKLRKAVSSCTQFRTAIDVGAHVGMWTMQLAKKFSRVCSFEPVDVHRECFYRNVEAKNVHLYPAALGADDGSVTIKTAATSSGDSSVNSHTMLAAVDGDGVVPMYRLDSFAFTDVDFLKIDCEGYELFILRGGEDTVRRCRPVIIVEQKPGHAQKFGLPERGAVDYLVSLGYRLEVEMSGDFIMTCA